MHAHACMPALGGWHGRMVGLGPRPEWAPGRRAWRTPCTPADRRRPTGPAPESTPATQCPIAVPPPPLHRCTAANCDSDGCDAYGLCKKCARGFGRDATRQCVQVSWAGRVHPLAACCARPARPTPISSWGGEPRPCLQLLPPAWGRRPCPSASTACPHLPPHPSRSFPMLRHACRAPFPRVAWCPPVTT